MRLYLMINGMIRAELALTDEIQAREKVLNGTAGFVPLVNARNQMPKSETWQNEDPRKSQDNLIRDQDSAAEKSEDQYVGSIAMAYQLNTRMEQSPNPDSRVTIGVERDALGVPRANLHWELSPIDKRSIRTLFKIIGHQAGASGVGRLKLKEFLWDEDDDSSWSRAMIGGWHHMGTTRMHEDPSQGVVDANCKVHRISNLFVAGSACFPTAGAANPTLTLVALSIRLSDHVRGLL